MAASLRSSIRTIAARASKRWLPEVGPVFRVDGCLSLSRAFGDFSFKRMLSLPPADQRISVPRADLS